MSESSPPEPPQEDETPETILSIDPGRAKCGIAIVEEGTPPLCRHRRIVETLRLTIEVGDLCRRFPEIGGIIIGSGTGSAPLRRALKSTFLNLPVTSVDEHGSSERARARYLAEHIPIGWRRLIPPSMRVPECAYDDYAALILAEEYFLEKLGKKTTKV